MSFCFFYCNPPLSLSLPRRSSLSRVFFPSIHLVRDLESFVWWGKMVWVSGVARRAACEEERRWDADCWGNRIVWGKCVRVWERQVLEDCFWKGQVWASTNHLDITCWPHLSRLEDSREGWRRDIHQIFLHYLDRGGGEATPVTYSLFDQRRFFLSITFLHCLPRLVHLRKKYRLLMNDRLSKKK